MLGTGRLSRAAALLVSSPFVMAASAAPSERLVEGFEGRTGPIRTSNASAEIVVAAGATRGARGCACGLSRATRTWSRFPFRFLRR